MSIETNERIPNLCALFGVDVDEKFKVDGQTVSIDKEGRVMPDTLEVHRAVLRGLEDPSLVEPMPQLSFTELDICGALGAHWVTHDKEACNVTLWTERPSPYGGGFIGNGKGIFLGCIVDTLFPTVKPGDCIEIEDERD